MKTVELKCNEILEWRSKYRNKLSYFTLKVGYDILPPAARLSEDIEGERDFFTGACPLNRHR
jgi:hypothetical protein